MFLLSSWIQTTRSTLDTAVLNQHRLSCVICVELEKLHRVHPFYLLRGRTDNICCCSRCGVSLPVSVLLTRHTINVSTLWNCNIPLPEVSRHQHTAPRVLHSRSSVSTFRDGVCSRYDTGIKSGANPNTNFPCLTVRDLHEEATAISCSFVKSYDSVPVWSLHLALCCSWAVCSMSVTHGASKSRRARGAPRKKGIQGWWVGAAIVLPHETVVDVLVPNPCATTDPSTHH